VEFTSNAKIVAALLMTMALECTRDAGVERVVRVARQIRYASPWSSRSSSRSAPSRWRARTGWPRRRPA